MGSSARLYKWLAVTKQVEKQQLNKGLFSVVTALDYAIQLYDYLQTVLLYLTARSMRARVLYEGPEKGANIVSVTFVPLE